VQKIVISGWKKYQKRSDLKTMPWFAVDSNIGSDDKLFDLQADQKWFWIWLLAEVAKTSPSDGEVEYREKFFAFYSGLSVSRIRQVVDHLKQEQMIEIIDGEVQDYGDVIKKHEPEVTNPYTYETNVTNKTNKTNKTNGQDEHSPPNTAVSEDVVDVELGEVLEFWNEQRVMVHKNPSRSKIQKLKKALRARRKDFSVIDVKKAIENYSRVFHGDQYFWTHKWTLLEFLQRENADKFFPDEFDFMRFRSNIVSVAKQKQDAMTSMINPYTGEKVSA